jgi:hypothetical protein
VQQTMQPRMSALATPPTCASGAAPGQLLGRHLFMVITEAASIGAAQPLVALHNLFSQIACWQQASSCKRAEHDQYQALDN